MPVCPGFGNDFLIFFASALLWWYYLLFFLVIMLAISADSGRRCNI